MTFMDKFKFEIQEKTLHFKSPAGTSRGVYHTRKIYLVTFRSTQNPALEGVGECAPLPILSMDDITDYVSRLETFCVETAREGQIPFDDMRGYPSMLFGLESAMAQIRANGSTALYDTPFAQGQQGIPINGLVWMGTYEEMMQMAEEKIRAGFTCLKFKIGGIRFEDEIEIIRGVRQRFGKDVLQIRLDANGAFSASDALHKIEQLSAFDIHSLEQPIPAGMWQEMRHICQQTAIPIALDEELIRVCRSEDKKSMLDTIRPHYLVLKPTLHGGIRGTEEWIDLAHERQIKTWITSALESNIGLNAIAHLTARLYSAPITIPQGLGTGQLFTDNIDMPLRIIGDKLWYKP